MDFFASMFKKNSPNTIEEYISKKQGHSEEKVFHRSAIKIGYVRKYFIYPFKSAKQFLESNYAQNTNAFPSLGWQFDDQNKESLNMMQTLKNKQDVQRSLGTFASYKVKKPAFSQPKGKPEAPKISSSDHQITTQQEYLQSIFQQEYLEEAIDYSTLNLSDNKVNQAWSIVTKNALKVGRFKAKYRSDFREFLKRIAYLCAKEARRRFGRCQKQQKEYQMRAKKVSKEVLSYWRKREKELIEIKKRKERLEQEKKKREEEEREQLLQKKRLEFLMKQSDIYAHFMAKKLGIDIAIAQTSDDLMYGGKKIQIDEDLALEKVAQIIDDNRQMLTMFDGPQKAVQDGNTMKELQVLSMDFSQVNQESLSQLIKPPASFVGELKEYQLKGLRWLDNLYDQGINGILADEMGLGKTIQAIALLAHISYNKNVWGPFLVVAPSSTLHNWQQEMKKFCPHLRVLPYWGQSQQRKTIRKYFCQRNFGKAQSHFHVVVTSYNLIVTDNKIFHRVRWQYMILDEAQAIKNINSQRWTTLLSFNARNRLLLTGTPIQNTMGELWALLHFIMPKFFDSFEQFQEWFSKDIEAHSMDQKSLNQHQLQRLHSILKPFMLRRLKKDVEHEIGQKKEIQIVCQMTSRQLALYTNLKLKLSIKIFIQDFFRMLDSKAKVENLMNLVMQFRKICNHPELFERKPYRSPYHFVTKAPAFVSHHPQGQVRDVGVTQANPIVFFIPKLIYDDLVAFDFRQGTIKRFNIHTANYIHRNRTGIYMFSCFLGLSLNFYQTIFNTDKALLLQLTLLHVFTQIKNGLQVDYKNERKYKLWISKQLISDHRVLSNETYQVLPTLKECITCSAQARPIQIVCKSSSFTDRLNRSIKKNFVIKLIDESPLTFILPNTSSQLISQSAKLRYLDKLLKELRSKHWRVLIFCQMTKMLDILEEYMLFKGYSYFRMDGQCQINDRRDMVNEFQSNDKIFAFLLSTRAGGLGITLTQADAVIFYDNDWNPTMDAQATDRAHRIGRTKDVWVYRLVTKGTIEERIVQRAQQKQNVQSTVYAGGAFQGDKFKPQEVMELLFDKNEIDDNVTKKFMTKGSKKKKKVVGKQSKKQTKKQNNQQMEMEQEGSNQEEEGIIEVNLDALEKNEVDSDDAE